MTRVFCSLWLVATLAGCRERVSLTESLMDPIERATAQATTQRTTQGTIERSTPPDEVADAARREQLWNQARERGWNIGAPLGETGDDERVPVAGFDTDPIEPDAAEGAQSFERSELSSQPAYERESSEPGFESAEERAGGAADELGVGGAAMRGQETTVADGSAGGAGPEAAWDRDALTDEELAEQEAWELAWQDRWEEQQALAQQAWDETQLLAEDLAETNAALSELQAENERLRQEAELAALLGFFNAQRLLAVQQGLMLMGAAVEGASPAQTGESAR